METSERRDLAERLIANRWGQDLADLADTVDIDRASRRIWQGW
jgi:hypothetical protein